MNGVVSDKFSVSPVHLFFLMYVSLIGFRTMSFQHDTAFDAGHDAWISVIIASLFTALAVWMMVFVLSRQKLEQANLVSINKRYFGTIAGTAINFILILYFVFGSFVAVLYYLQIIHVWIFPHSHTWPIGLIILLIVYYAISGGFQSVTGLCMWGTVSIFLFIMPQLFAVLPRLHPDNIFPVFNHNLTDIMKSSGKMAHEYIRCEILLVIYPFIRNQKKAIKWSFWAVLAGGLLNLILSIVGIMYFSQAQLEQIPWPTLSLISTLDYPLMQRMESLLITIWLVKILAIVSLGLWAACHSMKQNIRLKQRLSLKVFIGLILILLLFIKNDDQIQMVTRLYSTIGQYIVFCYIPILFGISMFLKNNAVQNN